MKTIRLKTTDQLGNISYLIIGPVHINLTNPSLVPLSLSNITADSALLTFMLQDIRDSDWPDEKKVEAYINALNMKCYTGWSKV